MAKKKKQPLTKDGRVTPFFMTRLRAVYRDQLKTLADQNRRPMTSEIEIALEEYLAKNGLWPPAGGLDD